MLVILYIVQPSDDHKMLIKLKRNKMFEEYQFDRLHFKQTLQMMMAFDVFTPSPINLVQAQGISSRQNKMSLSRGERCDFNPAELCQGDEFAKAKQIFGALNLDVWQRQCAR